MKNGVTKQSGARFGVLDVYKIFLYNVTMTQEAGAESPTATQSPALAAYVAKYQALAVTEKADAGDREKPVRGRAFPLNIRLSEDDYLAVRRLGDAEDITPADYVRVLVRRGLRTLA